MRLVHTDLFHFLNQSDSKPKRITIWLPAFSPASSNLLVLTLSSHGLFAIFFFVLIGCRDYFRSVSKTLGQNTLYMQQK